MTDGGWQYRHHVWYPEDPETEEEWAARLASEGWRMWMGPGGWLTINGRRGRHWSLRRWVERPFAIAGHEGRIWSTPPDDIDE